MLRPNVEVEVEIWKWKLEVELEAGSGSGSGSGSWKWKLENKWTLEMQVTPNTVISSATNPLIECLGLLNGNTAALTPRAPT